MYLFSWHVSHPVITVNKHNPILPITIDSPTELDLADDISDVFAGAPPKKQSSSLSNALLGKVVLFLDLPEPSPNPGDSIPERFKSSILLAVLEKIGCGKTRSMTEMLYLQWGFYFNASSKDFGSDDLFSLAELIDRNIDEHSSRLLFATIVREEFELLHDKLSALDHPNFSNGSKLRLVIDEAQILSDKNPTSFTSSATQGDLPKMC
ncbi:hypothetical protein BGW38_003127 [Lunasporangiospora selenospora]|uniref:Uncharacterized protein n=1 Tax=Lunasporangiospora selenospora TaxID=979761 RepID=A0A9P6FRU7_9FUNG|nr:hypothetical protein BGW38_003127 [Lunasporangiospora selenospora]